MNGIINPEQKLMELFRAEREKERRRCIRVCAALAVRGYSAAECAKVLNNDQLVETFSNLRANEAPGVNLAIAQMERN